MVKTKKPPTAFRVVWRIVEAGLWETEPFDPRATPEIGFDDDGTGRFEIAAIHADLDRRYAGSRVEFSFEGEDEGEAVVGRGFAEIVKPGRLQGHLYFHFGPESAFAAERVPRLVAVRQPRSR